MDTTVDLGTFIGNRRTVDILKRAIAQNRLPHAMIFAGPAGVGKCTLALLAAQALNCTQPRGEEPCGECAACRRIRAYVASRHKECAKGGKSACGVCPVCQARNRRHPDIRLVEPEKKTLISIEQIREVIDEIAFQPLEARYRVVILDPADQMNAAGQNSLLKTLEEPSSRTVLILIATNPYMLLETIRSRARILPFGEIPREEIVRHLVANGGKSETDARLAAALSGGSLTAALEFDAGGYKETRESALEFVSLLLGRGAFADASALVAKVAKVAKDKDKVIFQAWLDSADALLQDVYYAGIADGRVGQRDLMEKLRALRQKTGHGRLVGAIEGMRRLRGDLKVNVNKQLALEALFLKLSRA
ncbi:MAG: DNA polymerase III subunit delta' [Acidobacteriota bacterium]|jgi:DNA polymerase-3 subunit delta'|nr:DNA polymerase III subunit delta' [Acidobacteriota bacterium]